MKLSDRRKLQLTIIILAAGTFYFFLSASPLAQIKSQFPAPTTRVNDFAAVLDEATKTRLENMLENLKQHNKIEFYVALVESTAGQDIFEFSRQLANDWNIGSRTARKKSLLLVVSVNDKVAFTQFSRSVQSDLPDGVLGDMSQRMRSAIAMGRYVEAVNTGMDHFVGVLAHKVGLRLQDFEQAAQVASAAVTAEPTPIGEVTGARTQEVTASQQRSEISDLRSQIAAADTPAKQAEVPTKEATTPEPQPRRARKTKAAARNRPDDAAATDVPIKKVTTTPDDEAEAEEVELTLTLPFDQRVIKLKEFLKTHPQSKARAHATELLISAYAAVGDQKLRSGDSAGGIEMLFLAIDEGRSDMSEKLFSGVIAQIPLNLYLSGERAAAFKAAKSVETKYAREDAKRLLGLAAFYLRVEQGDEAARVAAQAVMLAPDMAEAHQALAFGLHISLRLEEAMAEYKRALELDPHSKDARRSLANLNRAVGRPEEALALYREELTGDPEDKAARAGLVISLLESGKREEANTELEAALKSDPRNLALLTGAAYWFVAHDDSERGLELARRAVDVEPRYTWAQIAAARALVARNQPLEAERALRYARQYGKFPTLDYELASVLASAGLYDEAFEALHESFVLKDGQVETHLGGRKLARAPDFIELLAPERRASIFQFSAADTTDQAAVLKALLVLNTLLNDTEGKVDEAAVVAAAKEFAGGKDEMRVYRQLYAATRLLRRGIGLTTVNELSEAARSGVDTATGVPAATVAVQAEEFRDIRARAIAAGGTPNIADAPRNVLGNILRGRIEDLTGWSLFSQEKPTEALEHLKQAANMLPEGTPSWRTALWHLGAALEQTNQNEQALSYYIKSYVTGEPDPVRRQLIEQLYRKVNGSLDGLDQRLAGSSSTAAVASPSPEPSATTAVNSPSPGTTESATVTSSPAANSSAAAATPSPEAVSTPSPDVPPKTATDKPAEPDVSPDAAKAATPEPTPTATPAPDSSQPTLTEEQALARASARVRASIKITGRVKDSDNKGIPNVVVVLISPRGTVLASTTDAEGYYSFSVSPSQRSYRLVPSKEGFSFAPLDKSLVAFTDDLKEIDFVASRSP